jgi:hypothetical protein
MYYPQYIGIPPHYDILYSKEENKYRFNQFWDIVADRGELSHGGRSLFITTANGVNRQIVNTAVNYLKPIIQRKKLRHSFPTRRSSDLCIQQKVIEEIVLIRIILITLFLVIELA